MINTYFSPAFPSVKKPVTLTIGTATIAKARQLRINTSRAAEARILNEIRLAEAQRWHADNAIAVVAYNATIDEHGLFHQPDWA